MAFFGYHAVYEHGYMAAIKAAVDHGFQFVQFDLNVPEFYIDSLSHRQLDDIKAASADRGVAISFHAPGDIVGLFTDYPLIRAGMLDHLSLVLQKANRLGAHHLTVHPLAPPYFRRADSFEDSFQTEHQEYFKQVLKDNLKQLTEAAGGVLIVVENCHLGMSAKLALAEIFSAGTDVFLTLDWAKMHRRGPELDENQYSFYAEHKHRIRELHLHDVDQQGRSHLAPGQGALNFEPLFDQFYDPGHWLTIEVRPVLEAGKAKCEFMRMIERLADGS